MKKSVWCSYDLGVKGDYTNLYRWLANKEAVECGSSVAYFKIEVKKGGDVFQLIEDEIRKAIVINNGERIYVVYKDEDNIRGKFVIGNRKANPWEGYGDQPTAEEDGL